MRGRNADLCAENGSCVLNCIDRSGQYNTHHVDIDVR
jgi:hypothetical protein